MKRATEEMCFSKQLLYLLTSLQSHLLSWNRKATKIVIKNDLQKNNITNKISRNLKERIEIRTKAWAKLWHSSTKPVSV